jgi:phosphoglycolate phosphatase-like HAD superfamily hydrolase
MPLAKFVHQYKTVIFDMDGVITSEQNYWNSAALTVYEFLHSSDFFGSETLCAKECMKNVSAIRREVFDQDKLIGILKEKGVNSNWDLAYLIICLELILPGKSSQERYEYIHTQFSDSILNDYDWIAEKTGEIIGHDASRTSEFWKAISQVFQHWFLGDELYFKTNPAASSIQGKTGFLQEEKPIIDGDILREIMSSLQKAGIRLGIATGRPQDEMMAPLQSFGIDPYLDSEAKISYTYIKNAEDALGGISLTKPHPYIFLKSLLGKNYSDRAIAEENYDHSLAKTALIVGDAGADILAAQNMGSDFLAVLTGVKGQKGRSYFESLCSTYILNSLADLLE